MKHDLQNFLFNSIKLILLLVAVLIMTESNLNAKKKKKVCKKFLPKGSKKLPCDTIQKIKLIGHYGVPVVGEETIYRSPEEIASHKKYLIHALLALKYNQAPQKRELDSITKIPAYLYYENIVALTTATKNKRKETDSIYFHNNNVKAPTNYVDSVLRVWEFPQIK
jgi:hypothetical protein